MAKSKKRKRQARAEPTSSQSFLCSVEAYETLCCSGYTKLSQNPEIISAVNKIAELISSMTIYLMANTDSGDVRIRNELSRKLDINPNQFMTRKTFMAAIVRILLLEGDGNAVVVPQYRMGLLDDLVIIPPSNVSFVPDGYGYKVCINGIELKASEVLHYVINPGPTYPWKGEGYRVALKDVAHTLKQAAATKKGFMESKWKPSIIVKVDSNADEFASKEGRSKLLSQYLETSEAGEPWMVPAETFEIQEVRPLSLNDIALPDSVKLDKKTVAAILDVPPFVVGEGDFDQERWNNFINTRIRSIANVIEMENTKKILIDPKWYFKLNIRSLYAYDIEKLSKVGDDNYTRGIMKGNEVRDWLGLDPLDGLDELVILENYIPQGMIGEQNKLNGG